VTPIQIRQPVAASMKTDGYSTMLQFDENTVHELMMVGGICWPVPVRTDDGLNPSGAAVLLGMDIEHDHVYIFEEREFLCVDHVLRPDGGIDYPGACSFFNMTWKTYFGRRFYYHQDDLTHRRYLRQVVASRMIQPKPRFHEAFWSDDRQAAIVMDERLERETLHAPAGSLCQKAVEMSDINDTGKSRLKDSHILTALVSALVGVEKLMIRMRRHRYAAA